MITQQTITDQLIGKIHYEADQLFNAWMIYGLGYAGAECKRSEYLQANLN